MFAEHSEAAVNLLSPLVGIRALGMLHMQPKAGLDESLRSLQHHFLFVNGRVRQMMPDARQGLDGSAPESPPLREIEESRAWPQPSGRFGTNLMDDFGSSVSCSGFEVQASWV